MRIILAAMGLAALAGSAAAERTSALGIWKVSAVANEPDMAVTELVDNDPSYLGATLAVSAAAIRWAKGASDGTGIFDGCTAPAFTPAADGKNAVTGGGSPWGPGAILTPLSHDRLKLEWHDGGVLTLTRE